jgi:thioesterase domain-containing protein
MGSSRYLQEIRPGMTPPVVAVDFRGGRPEADFVDLLDVGAMPHQFLELIPPGLDGTESVTPTAKAYARVYADVLADEVDARPVLIGFCSGALIALALAEELDARGASPLAVGLFDAEPMGFEHVVSCYAGLTSGGAPPRAMQEAARQELAAGSFGDATAAMIPALETDLRRQLDELGVPAEDEQGRELLDRQAAWFRYILATAGAPHSSGMPPSRSTPRSARVRSRREPSVGSRSLRVTFSGPPMCAGRRSGYWRS